MPIASRLSQFFNRKGIEWRCLHHDRCDNLADALVAADLDESMAVQGTLLVDARGAVMAVYPFQANLDLDAVNRKLKRQLRPLPADRASRLFCDCEATMQPPLGQAYGISTIVHESLLSWPCLYMASGCRSTLLELDGRAFRLAMAGSARADIVSDEGAQCAPQPTGGDRNLSLEDVAARLQKLYRLPPMPAVALRILHLTADEDSSARELAQLIERDPSLAAQVMRYARSALFNYRGEITNVQDAVTRVLGFDRVAHVAMGIAASRAFDLPRDGMLGLDAFWRHSLYSAYLTQRIAELGGGNGALEPGLAYLSGLLHNFGILLIGHLFPPEYRLLNKLREANPQHPMALLEQQVFGMGGAQDLITVGHGAVGGILLKLWQLPEAVVKAAGMHQRCGYQGDHAPYVHAVQLANLLLQAEGIGDEFDEGDPLPLAQQLGLGEAELDKLRAATEEAASELDALAHSLAA